MITLAQQRERRRHIISVTLGVARGGGYETVRMRAVAERADVAVATLYRYFPSKPNRFCPPWRANSTVSSAKRARGRPVPQIAMNSCGK
jgi:Bacterial regulatory proteins, tetR family